MTDSRALVLSGGGARAAYQIGVLNAVNEILSQPKESPFSIITGVSAGAINGTVLATHNHQFSHGLARLSKIWQNFQPNQVYKTGAGHLSKNFFHWLWALAKPKNQNQKAISLLDNSPLESLLASMVKFESIDSNIQLGNLTALCTTSYDYNSGDSVSFHQSINTEKTWIQSESHRVCRRLTFLRDLAYEQKSKLFTRSPRMCSSHGFNIRT